MEEVYSNKINDLIEKNWKNQDIKIFFRTLLDFLKTYLELQPIITEFQIEVSEKILPFDDVFSFGIERKINNNFLNLKLTNENPELHPIILLREAYYCFLPSEVLQNKIIKMIINQVVEINLENHKYINRWKKLIRKNIVDIEYVQNQLESFKTIFKLRSDRFENPIKFFFEFTRKNITIVEKDVDLFHNQMMHEYMFKISRTLQNDEVVETIRNLITIFYRVKYISSKSEYKDNFIKFKKQGIIDTELSTRKFVENLRWLKNYSFLAPNYKVDYNRLGISGYAIIFQFHPYVSKKNIRIIIETMPFLRYIRMSENGFSIKVIGYVYIPKKYNTSFLYFLKFLLSKGFLIDILCIDLEELENNLNLNYFREYHNQNLLIDRNHQNYDVKYESSTKYNYNSIQDFNNDLNSLTPLEFLILDRIRYIAFTGFGFVHNKEILNELKSDYLNEILSQITFIKDLKENLNKLNNNPSLKNELIIFLDSLSSAGSFYIKNLLDSISEIAELFKNIISDQEIYSPYEFQTFIENNAINLFSKQLENGAEKKLFLKRFFPFYFDNKSKYNEEIEKYTFFSTIIKNFFSLKIFNLNAIKKIIENQHIASDIFSKKQSKLIQLRNKYKIQDIKIKKIEKIIKKFLESDPSIIKPSLVNTISTTNFAKYNIILVLKNTPEVVKILNAIKFYFPRVIILSGKDLLSKKKLMYLEIYLQNISSHEKGILISILYTTFRENLLQLSRLYSHGVIEIFSLKDFYDFENKSYFYTRDLFSQYQLFINQIFGNQIQKFSLENNFKKNYLLSNKNDFNSLVNTVYKRNSWEQLNFNTQDLYQLEKFHKNLSEVLSNLNKFKAIKNERFFKKHIKSIKFIPQFQKFRFSNYFLWFATSNLKIINKKSLLINTFLSVKYPAEINQNLCSFLINYLFPYRTPNDSYFNWLLKSKKIFSEYLLFSIKNLYQILHFNYNISPEGWDLDANHFNSFAKKVIYKQKYTLPLPSLKKYDLSTISNILMEPKSQEFNDLKNLYNYQPDDLKSFLAQDNHYKSDSFRNLHSKKLLFSYLELKNLGFREIFYFIIPDISPKIIDTLIKIFGFFNYCFIFEIQGEFFLNGMNDVHYFEDGLFIELHLPDCEFSEFCNAFHEIFDLLGVKRYSIIHDLLDGKKFLKETFEDLTFLDSYNPLTNLEWNKKDKIWMNPKLFDEKFNFLKINI